MNLVRKKNNPICCSQELITLGINLLKEVKDTYKESSLTLKKETLEDCKNTHVCELPGLTSLKWLYYQKWYINGILPQLEKKNPKIHKEAWKTLKIQSSEWKETIMIWLCHNSKVSMVSAQKQNHRLMN